MSSARLRARSTLPRGKALDTDRRPSHRLARGLRDAERTARKPRSQRARPYHRRKRRGKSLAVSRHRRALALGERPDYSPGASIPIMFMPVRAYIPPGTLREAVAYPHSTDVYDAAAIVKALRRCRTGTPRAAPGHEDRWDRQLTDDEKQCLAFVRVILQKPRWVVVNDALDVLDPKSRMRIRALFTSANLLMSA